jgi:hypothetical protein
VEGERRAERSAAEVALDIVAERREIGRAEQAAEHKKRRGVTQDLGEARVHRS